VTRSNKRQRRLQIFALFLFSYRTNQNISVGVTSSQMHIFAPSVMPRAAEFHTRSKKIYNENNAFRSRVEFAV